MRNWPFKNEWEYLREMGQHFPIKPGEPIEMALAILNPFAEFPN